MKQYIFNKNLYLIWLLRNRKRIGWKKSKVRYEYISSSIKTNGWLNICHGKVCNVLSNGLLEIDGYVIAPVWCNVREVNSND